MINRPSWDDYFMALCFLVAQRSIDPSTKHGTVFVSNDNTILSLGYNSPPRGCDDNNVPLTRPEKYDWFIHSEEAAMLNAARIGISLKGSLCYVTGKPCEKCFRQLINVGCTKIIYGCISSGCITEETEKLIDQIHAFNRQSIVIQEYNCDKIEYLLSNTIEYFKSKQNE